MPRTLTPPERRAAQAADHVDGGRLAGPVGPEKAEDLPALNLQAEVVDGGEGAESFGDTYELDGRFGHAFSSLGQARSDPSQSHRRRHGSMMGRCRTKHKRPG